jgi:Spy/CpxP family protein refolding chaperone
MRSSFAAISLVLGLALHAKAAAEPQQDPIRERLYPPDLIMQHQSELRIDERQRTAIAKEQAAFQSQIVDLQWKMSSATDELARLLDAPHIDEARALAQADKVMAIEHDVKRTHLALLIRVRNLLTDAQRAELAKLRAKLP